MGLTKITSISVDNKIYKYYIYKYKILIILFFSIE